MISYSLHDNVLTTEDETDYMAIIQNSEKCSIEDLIKGVTVAGSILKETESVAVTHAIFRELGKNLREGKGFSSEYLTIDHSISGVFIGEDDQFDPQRHKVNVNVRLASTLREMTRNIPVQKVKSSIPMPTLESCYDHWTQTTNDQITPKASVDLRGEYLKIGDTDDAQQGVFLLNSQKVETKVDRLALNTPKKLTFAVPDGLAKGEYSLLVRTVFKGTTKLREGRLNQTLVIA